MQSFTHSTRYYFKVMRGYSFLVDDPSLFKKCICEIQDETHSFKNMQDFLNQRQGDLHKHYEVSEEKFEEVTEAQINAFRKKHMDKVCNALDKEIQRLKLLDTNNKELIDSKIQVLENLKKIFLKSNKWQTTSHTINQWLELASVVNKAQTNREILSARRPYSLSAAKSIGMVENLCGDYEINPAMLLLLQDRLLDLLNQMLKKDWTPLVGPGGGVLAGSGQGRTTHTAKQILDKISDYKLEGLEGTGSTLQAIKLLCEQNWTTRTGKLFSLGKGRHPLVTDFYKVLSKLLVNQPRSLEYTFEELQELDYQMFSAAQPLPSKYRSSRVD